MNNLLAVVTKSKYAFTKFCKENGYNEKDAKQVSVLRDIQGVVFSDKIVIEDAENVTEYVINNIKINKDGE